MRWRLFPLLNLMYFHYSFRRNLNNPANYSDFPRNQHKLRSRLLLHVKYWLICVWIIANWHKKWTFCPTNGNEISPREVSASQQCYVASCENVTFTGLSLPAIETLKGRKWVLGVCRFPSEGQSETSGHMLREALSFVWLLWNERYIMTSAIQKKKVSLSIQIIQYYTEKLIKNFLQITNTIPDK